MVGQSAALLLYITVKSSRVQCSTAQEHRRSGRTVLAECRTSSSSNNGRELLPSLGPIKGVGSRRRLSGKCGEAEKRLYLSMSQLRTPPFIGARVTLISQKGEHGENVFIRGSMMGC